MWFVWFGRLLAAKTGGEVKVTSLVYPQKLIVVPFFDGPSGPGGGSTGKFQSPGGPGSVGSKTSYGDYLKNLYGKKKSADGITPLPSSTMSKGKSAGGPSADSAKNPGNQMISPDNNIPAINAEAMHSDEKIEVLGIEIS